MVHNRRMKYGYARISTIDQNADIQLKALERAGVDKKNIFKDELSGATTKRPSLLRCLKKLQDGDTLIVWKLEHLSKFFTGSLASIRRVDVQRYITKRAGEVSTHSVQKELNVLKHLLRLAVEWEIVPVNPSQGVKSPRVPAGRVRYLQPTELGSLLTACPEWLRPIVGFAVATGMRRSEILGLRWLNVDWSQASTMLPQTKNGEGRIVPLNQLALAALRSVAPLSETKLTGLVFTGITPEQVSVAFARLCRSQKVIDFRFHDLRHTAASWMRMKGADIHTVAQLLGHKDLRMAARYQHLSPAFLARGVETLDSVFEVPCYPHVTGTKQLTDGLAATA